jgi:hypothetical protein
MGTGTAAVRYESSHKIKRPGHPASAHVKPDRLRIGQHSTFKSRFKCRIQMQMREACRIWATLETDKYLTSLIYNRAHFRGARRMGN